jgi:hypothetical protein
MLVLMTRSTSLSIIYQWLPRSDSHRHGWCLKITPPLIMLMELISLEPSFLRVCMQKEVIVTLTEWQPHLLKLLWWNRGFLHPLQKTCVANWIAFSIILICEKFSCGLKYLHTHSTCLMLMEGRSTLLGDNFCNFEGVLSLSGWSFATDPQQPMRYSSCLCLQLENYSAETEVWIYWNDTDWIIFLGFVP